MHDLEQQIYMEDVVTRVVRILDRFVAAVLIRVPVCFFNHSVSKGGESLIIGLTTYPARINDVHWTLRSLLMQSMKASQIILVISRLEFPLGEEELPSNIRRLIVSSKGRLRIMVTDDNLKSYKKLLPILESCPDQTIITVDDDVIYRKSLVKKLFAAHRKYPNFIVGTRGTIIVGFPEYTAPYITWPRAELYSPGPSIFLTGRGGILYPQGSLNDQATDRKTISDLCPTADDIWFKAMSLLNNTDSMVINTGREYPSSSASQSQALWRVNVESHENDRAISKTFKYFSLIE